MKALGEDILVDEAEIFARGRVKIVTIKYMRLKIPPMSALRERD
jgi:hypothetical protein